MSKTTKIIIIVVVAIVVILIAFFMLRGKSEVVDAIEEAITGPKGITPQAVAEAKAFKAASNWPDYSESTIDWGAMNGGITAWIKGGQPTTAEEQSQAVGYFKGMNLKPDGWAVENLKEGLKFYLESGGRKFPSVQKGEFLKITA